MGECAASGASSLGNDHRAVVCVATACSNIRHQWIKSAAGTPRPAGRPLERREGLGVSPETRVMLAACWQLPTFLRGKSDE
jgi:hypothetical protein